MDTVGALSADRRQLVLVHVNGGIHPRRLAWPAGWGGGAIVTDATRTAVCLTDGVAPPRSIVTLVLTRGGGRGCPAPRRD
jgi:hypothetical protein